ncbi:MAG: hypothetical protein EBZ44_06300, partial [Verrucomicrobia bacterium]|nr:hypothetical protein [Verrucomicrobiota bacterium]
MVVAPEMLPEPPRLAPVPTLTAPEPVAEPLVLLTRRVAVGVRRRQVEGAGGVGGDHRETTVADHTTDFGDVRNGHRTVGTIQIHIAAQIVSVGARSQSHIPLKAKVVGNGPIRGGSSYGGRLTEGGSIGKGHRPEAESIFISKTENPLLHRH